MHKFTYIITVLLGCITFYSCEEKFEDFRDTELSVIQYKPIQENGYWLLSGKLTSNHSMDGILTGFYYERSQFYDYNLNAIDWAGVNNGNFIRAEHDKDGYFSAKLPIPDGYPFYDGSLYICSALAAGGIDLEINSYYSIPDENGNSVLVPDTTWTFQQSIVSQPYVADYTYKETFLIELSDTLTNTFTRNGLEYTNICWAEHDNPTILDNLGTDFGNAEKVYVRGYEKKLTVYSEQITYSSNVIELSPHSLVKHIYTQEDSIQVAEISKNHDPHFRGRLILHRDVAMRYIDCTIEGNNYSVELLQVYSNGSISNAKLIKKPDTYHIANSGKITNCIFLDEVNNYRTGIIEGCSQEDISYGIGDNQGLIIKSDLRIASNYGIVENCVFKTCFMHGDYSSWYSDSAITNNESTGVIRNCSVQVACPYENPDKPLHYLCTNNSGIIQNCTPWERTCESNSGIIE